MLDQPKTRQIWSRIWLQKNALAQNALWRLDGIKKQHSGSPASVNWVFKNSSNDCGAGRWDCNSLLSSVTGIWSTSPLPTLLPNSLSAWSSPGRVISGMAKSLVDFLADFRRWCLGMLDRHRDVWYVECHLFFFLNFVPKLLIFKSNC